MRERLDIPEASAIPVVNRKRTTKFRLSTFPSRRTVSLASRLAELGTGYRVIHSINPHDERGDIEWDPKAFERLYHRITGKVRENRQKISTTCDSTWTTRRSPLWPTEARFAPPLTQLAWPVTRASRLES